MIARADSTQLNLERVGVLVDGLDHPEGVAVGPDRMVYAGGEAGQIYRIDPVSADVEVIGSTGGWVLGIAVAGNGGVVACDPKRSAVFAVTTEGQVVKISDGVPELRMETPNYPVFTDEALYVSDSGQWKGMNGRIYRISPDGETTLWSDEVPAFANGMALSPDGDAMFVVESTAATVSRIAIDPAGNSGPREVIVELPGTVPDGIAFDELGGLYIACYRPDRVYRLHEGSLDVIVEDFQGTVVGAPTNVAFGGPGRQRLYIASLQRWHIGVIDVEVPGTRLRYPVFPFLRGGAS